MAKTHLLFVLSEHSMHAAEMSDQSVTELGSIVFQGRKDFQYKEQIQAFLAEHRLTEKEYDEYSLSWFNPLSTLVPMNVFGASSAKEVFQACFTKEMISNDVDYNRISELSVVNVFEIPLWVKSFFVIRYPRIVIQHEGTHFLRGIFSNSTFKTGAHIVLHAQHFMLIVVKHNQLLFYNTFESANEDDVLYYLSFSLQQQALTGDAGQLYIYETSDSPAGMKNKLSDKVKLLKDLKAFSPVDTKYLPYKYQQTCV